jgi:hypothetical protein
VRRSLAAADSPHGPAGPGNGQRPSSLLRRAAPGEDTCPRLDKLPPCSSACETKTATVPPLSVVQEYERFPRQIVLYVGEPELLMEKELRGSNVWFEYSLIDIHRLAGERLLASEGVGDNVIVILAGLQDDEAAVYKIVKRIAGLAVAERETALAQLTILAGLRHLSKTAAWRRKKCGSISIFGTTRFWGPCS